MAQRVAHLFTAAELLNLVAAPYSFLPSPGPTKRYAFVALHAYYKFIAPAYTLNGNTFLVFNGVVSGLSSINLAQTLATATDKTYDTGGSNAGIPGAQSKNMPLTMGLNTAVNLTLGNGTLLVVIFYTIEDAA